MLRPLILPTDVWVRRPVPPVIPLRSSTNQAKKVMATTTISGLAALRKACIIAESRLRPRDVRRGMKLKADQRRTSRRAFCLAVDTQRAARYSHRTPPQQRSRHSPSSSDLEHPGPDGHVAKLKSWSVGTPKTLKGLTFAPWPKSIAKTAKSPEPWNCCRQGSSFIPNYIPASIVLGRCHLGPGRPTGGRGGIHPRASAGRRKRHRPQVSGRHQ